MTDSPVIPRRERVRTATINEIKATALELMSRSGVAELRFSDIARELGMTAPALYRYFADRDALLTALIADGYSDLADTLEAAAAPYPSPRGRLAAVMRSYRGWAGTDRTRFGLIFGAPIAGYSTPADAGTTASARRAMGSLETAVVQAFTAAALGPAVVPRVGRELRSVLPASRNVAGPALPAAAHQGMYLVWTGLHGFSSLEAFGHLDWMPEPARDDLFEAQIALAESTIGLV